MHQLRKNGKRLQVNPHKLFHHLDEVAKWKKGEYFAPVHVEMGPTYRCNQKCKWCYTVYMQERKSLELEREVFLKIMRDLGAAGVKSCCYQGCGEPFMNPHTPDAIVEGHTSGVDMAVVSNGVLFTEEKARKSIPHLSWMRISAMEADAKMYAMVHGCPEQQYHQLLKNIETAVKIGRQSGHPEFVMSAMMLVLDYNWQTVPEVTRLCKELGLQYILIKTASSSTLNKYQWEADIHKKHGDIIKQAMAYNDENFLVSIRWDIFEGENKGAFPKEFKKCFGVHFQTMIDSDACVYPCLHFWGMEDYKIGDLKKNTFEEIWKSQRKQEVFDRLWNHYNIDDCYQICKHSFINKSLWDIHDEPLHVNFT